jgi:PHD/YefM family antitoxin component YafN of YafNO toxin-antitoxin module
MEDLRAQINSLIAEVNKIEQRTRDLNHNKVIPLLSAAEFMVSQQTELSSNISKLFDLHTESRIKTTESIGNLEKHIIHAIAANNEKILLKIDAELQKRDSRAVEHIRDYYTFKEKAAPVIDNVKSNKSDIKTIVLAVIITLVSNFALGFVKIPTANAVEFLKKTEKSD